MSSDKRLTNALLQLAGNLPEPRRHLSESEKDLLIETIGPRTARSILAMRGKAPLRRIPFLFSSIDTQAIVDLLENDCSEAITRALKKRLPPSEVK